MTAIATRPGAWASGCTIGSAFSRYLSRTTGQVEIDGPLHQRHPRVVYIPGEFCVHPHGQLAEVGQRQLRLSYGFEELGQLDAAIGFMAEACAWSPSL